MPPPPYIVRGKEMKRMIALLIVGLLLSLTAASCVSADDKENTARNHGPIYVGSKPFHEYDDPGFVIGFYNRIDWVSPTSVGYLYSPHMLFGWDIGIANPPHPFKYSFAVGLFASRILFTSFGPSFVGIFTGTEPGFICGFVDDVCTFYYGNYSPEVTY